MEKDQRIKIAVQKSGRLTENSLELLHRLSLIHISEPTRQYCQSRMPSSA